MIGTTKYCFMPIIQRKVNITMAVALHMVVEARRIILPDG